MNVLVLLFGQSWKTSLIGLLSAAALALATFLQANQGQGLVWYVAAAAILLLSRFLPDAAPGGKSIRELLLGSAPLSTLLSGLAPLATVIVTYAQGQQGIGWYVIAIAVPAILRFAKVPGIDKAPPVEAVPQ